MSVRARPLRLPRRVGAIACAAIACAAIAGCASGAAGVDAAHERPGRPDAGALDAGGAAADAAIDDGGAGAPDAHRAIDGGARPDGGGAVDARVDSGARDAGSLCCATDADCGAFEVCVVTSAGGPGVCERMLLGLRDCWSDADCMESETCGGARVRDCTDSGGEGRSEPGRCR